MATFSELAQLWALGDGDKEKIFSTERGVWLRWLNEAQLRHAQNSEVLRNVWTPTLTSTGKAPLPSDFLREIPDRVKWQTERFLRKIDYPTAKIAEFSGTYYYSIWDGMFYVFSPAAGTPEIYYIKKPAAVAASIALTADLEIPQEFHNTLLLYLDAMYARRNKDIAGSTALVVAFDRAATEDGVLFSSRNDPVPVMRGRWF